MPFIIGAFSEANKMELESSIKTLKGLKGVVEQIIKDTEEELEYALPLRLEDGKISEVEYKGMLQQNEDELAKSKQSLVSINQKLERFEALVKNGKSSIVIQNDTTQDDLKHLTNVVRNRLKTPLNNNEQLFLESVLEKAEACLNRLKENKTPSSNSIPILDDELKYWQILTSKWQSQLHALASMRETCSKSDLNNEEKSVLIGIVDNLENKILSLPEGISVNELHIKIEEYLDESLMSPKFESYTSGFKGFINSIFKYFNKEPPFKLTVHSDFIEKLNAELDEIRESEDNKLLYDDSFGYEDLPDKSTNFSDQIKLKLQSVKEDGGAVAKEEGDAANDNLDPNSLGPTR